MAGIAREKEESTKGKMAVSIFICVFVCPLSEEQQNRSKKWGFNLKAVDKFEKLKKNLNRRLAFELCFEGIGD